MGRLILLQKSAYLVKKSLKLNVKGATICQLFLYGAPIKPMFQMSFSQTCSEKCEKSARKCL